LRSFRSSYLEIAKQLKEVQQKEGDKAPENIQQLDFEFVLFASAIIDYDYIMKLTAANLGKKPSKQRMTKEQIKGLLKSNSNFIEDEDISEFIDSLDWTIGQSENQLKQNFQKFKEEKIATTLAKIAQNNGLEVEALQQFTDEIISRMIFDADKLSELFEPLDLGWKERTKRELALMEELTHILKKKAEGHEISGLKAYDV